MWTLNLPDHGTKTKQAPEGERIFDSVRRQWVALTPEEWVRQHVLNFLLYELGCPKALIAVERKLLLNKLAKRADIVVYGRDGTPLLLVECKAPQVKLGPAAFEQAARYNSVFKVPYLMVTNGLVHYCCLVTHEGGKVTFLNSLPTYDEMAGRNPLTSAP